MSFSFFSPTSDYNKFIKTKFRLHQHLLFLPVVFGSTENYRQTNMAVDVRLIISALDTKPFSK